MGHRERSKFLTLRFESVEAEMCRAVYLSVCLLPGVRHRVHGLRLARISGWHALVSVCRSSQLHRYSYLDLHLFPVRQGGAQTAHQLDTDGNTQCLITRLLSPCTAHRPIPSRYVQTPHPSSTYSVPTDNALPEGKSAETSG